VTDPTYIIGIDLGTTNSVVAYTAARFEKGRPADIRTLDLPQLVQAGTVENRPLLPSFIFNPGPHDIPEGGLELPWDPDARLAVGEFARERGAEVPHRLIASAKSWLCNTMVDRNKPILPWEAPPDVERLSPVAASAAILRHIRDAWNFSMARSASGPEASLRMEHQDIYLTVPASFDAVARELTFQAARRAGLENVTLLEEPQAAFYAWIDAVGDRWREQVQKGDLVLVCDVGGGTSDFSLIRVSEADGRLELERIAVGDHLLVGGDNMDLALAYAVARRLAEQGTRLDAWQMRGLWHTCRQAKERLLSGEDTAAYPLTILGRGSKLIGGTLKTELSREEVDQVILDGFLPACEPSASPQKVAKAGIKEIGLAYEADPAVTRHLARFLRRQGAGEAEPRMPTAVLFNGGVMKARAVRRRILEILSGWRSGETPEPLQELGHADFDLAVARGATYYGLARRGEGIRIRGGLGRSYYIGVAASMPAVPGMPAPVKALCVAPFGMEEGSDEVLAQQEFALVVGEPVSFDFLASATRREDAPGTVVEDWAGEIEHITTIETTLDGEAGSVVPVTIEIRISEVGTLELWCVSGEDGRRWKLEFNVREQNNAG
jgi:molecular chaperone DnaK (HSP70)